MPETVTVRRREGSELCLGFSPPGRPADGEPSNSDSLDLVAGLRAFAAVLEADSTLNAHPESVRVRLGGDRDAHVMYLLVDVVSTGE